MGKNKCKTKDCENKTEKRKKYCPECSAAKKAKQTQVKCWKCKNVHPGIGQFCPHCCAPASGPANEDVMPSTESDVMSKVKRFPTDDVATLTQQFERAKLDTSASGDATSSTDSNRPVEEQPGTLSGTSKNEGHKTLNQQSANNISVQCSSGDNKSAATSEKSNKPSEEDHKKPDVSGNSMEANSTKITEKSHQPSENSGIIPNPDSVGSEPKPDKDVTPVVVRSTTIAVPSGGCDMQNQSKEKVGMVNSAPPDGTTTNSDGPSKSESDFDIKFVDEKYGENYGAGLPQQGVKEPTKKGSDTAENERQESQVFGPSAPDPKSVGHAFGTNQKSADNGNKNTSKDGMSPSVNNKTTEDHNTPLETSTNGEHKNQHSANKNGQSDQCGSGDNKSAAPATGTCASTAKGTQNENASLKQSDNNQTNTGTEGSSVDHDPLKNKPSYAQATGSQHLKPGESDNRRDGVKLVKDALKDIADSNQNKNPRIPKVLIDGGAKEKMTVFFHVVVTPEFQFNQKTDKIVMRFSPISFGNFHYDVVEMDYLRKENGFVFMEGKLPIKPSYFSDTNIQYKYILKRSGGTGSPYYNYEWIHKGHSSSIMNRLLKIPKEARKEQGVWHQFDGAMQIKETENFRKPKTESKSFQGRLWNSLKNVLHLGSDVQTKLLQDQMYAMLSYLPEWEGFVCNQKGQMIGMETALEAINRLCNVAKCMANMFVISDWYTSGSFADRWKPGEFSVEKVLQKYFNGKLKEIGRDEKNLSQTMLSQRLVSGLAIALVDKRFPFLENETRRLLLQSLVLPSDLQKQQYEKLIDDIKNTFPGQHLRSIAEALENICNRAMNPRKVDLTFILVLPLLHFVRQESKPMEWPKALNQYSINDYRWWGHDNLDVKAVQGKRIHQM
ncbi:E3 ubiquitin-protein ligase rnf213-alpha-like [Anneissia japonica]|uniref:E3 ubiquitin-protein ligase rnf213-alpha-like n=1 Tax=Anneissia japonica TaxID=1529436 RepID=UPI0014254E1F|nr:E3 ubiquitin-protein ligase rnf213-alpha-like [Anneissia japonica]